MAHSSQADEALVALDDLTPGRSDDFDPERRVLVGSRCANCAATVYPPAQVCFRCRGSNLTHQGLATEGTLQSFTRVRVSATRQVPYAIGYVDLPDDVRVLAPLHDSPHLACDAPVRLVANGGDWLFELVEQGDAP